MLLLEQIRLYPPTKHIPIIVCTAAVNEMREQEETFHHKGIPVIYKPFDIDELLEVVHQTLSLPLEE
jgi:CheY-like chemotaxis protein